MKKPAIVADENIPLSTIEALHKAGFEVVSVARRLPGASDVEVLRCACDRNAILLTFDRDYGELIFKRQCPAPHAVLYLRSVPGSPADLVSVVLKLLSGAAAGEIVGQFVAWSRDGTRKRAFP